MIKEKSCGAVVYKKDSEIKYLLVKQLKKYGHHWGFPKGKVEPGETEEETAIREVFEETGIKIIILPGFYEYIDYLTINGTEKKVIFFVGKATNNKIIMDKREIEEAEWFTFDEAMEKITFNNSKEILIKAEDFIKNKLISN
ncbi:MAG: NUDIX domain-containing protein [Candidatus Woesearchaeota archaeon]